MVALQGEIELDGDGGVDRDGEGNGVAGEGGLRGGREVGGVVAGGARGGVGRVEREVELVGVDAAVGMDGVEGACPVAGESGGVFGRGSRVWRRAGGVRWVRGGGMCVGSSEPRFGTQACTQIVYGCSLDLNDDC